jgi:hypothetical protein
MGFETKEEPQEEAVWWHCKNLKTGDLCCVDEKAFNRICMDNFSLSFRRLAEVLDEDSGIDRRILIKVISALPEVSNGE